MTTTTKIKASGPDEETSDFDLVLGSNGLFRLAEVAQALRVSIPTLYRAMRAGRVPYVMNGSRRALTRPVMKRLLREGIGPIS
jgi:excisionase family DNA binding protein